MLLLLPCLSIIQSLHGGQRDLLKHIHFKEHGFLSMYLKSDASKTLIYIQVTWGSCRKSDCDSVDLEWGWKYCIIDKLLADEVILDHISSNKSLEKNPNSLLMSYFIWPLPSNPTSSPTPVLHSYHDVATPVFILLLKCAKLFLPQGLCTWYSHCLEGPFPRAPHGLLLFFI